MGPTYLCKGIIIVGLILVWFAFFFNSPVAMVSAVAILLLIQWKLLSFQQKTNQFLSGIECHREIPAKYVRVGSSVSVRMSILVSVPGCLQAVLREIVSPGVIIQKGDVEYHVTGKKTEQIEIVYIAVPMVHGTLSFSGLSIRLTDAFFSDDIDLLNDRFSGPVLNVYPTGGYEIGLQSNEYGEQEIERIRAISGQQLHGFRKYMTGDDPKYIDWKMTAKYNDPIIRQYSGLGGTNPLIILDLPERVESGTPASFHTMVRAVSGVIDESWKKYRKTSLVLISGPNVIKTPETGDRVEQSQIVLNTSAYPVTRLQTYYRFQTSGALRKLTREISGSPGVSKEDKEINEYLKNIGSVVSSFQKDPHSVPVFPAEISRLFRIWPHETVIIFSMYSGDMSHIRFLIEQVHQDHGTVQLHVPDNTGDPGFRRTCMNSGADTVKVFS